MYKEWLNGVQSARKWRWGVEVEKCKAAVEGGGEVVSGQEMVQQSSNGGGVTVTA